MDRRSFLLQIGGAAVAVPLLLQASACGGGDDDAPAADSGPDAEPATSFSARGTLSGHAHEITIQCADLTGGDVTYTSTSTNGHTHPVALTAAQLGEISAGNAVTVTTTDAHPHEWVITKPSSACAG